MKPTAVPTAMRKAIGLTTKVKLKGPVSCLFKDSKSVSRKTAQQQTQKKALNFNSTHLLLLDYLVVLEYLGKEKYPTNLLENFDWNVKEAPFNSSRTCSTALESLDLNNSHI
jgi:hypothetical protein